MLKNKFCLLLTGSFLVLTSGLVSLFPQSASADTGDTRRVVPDRECSIRNDYFKLWNGTTEANGVCFAYPGTVDIQVYNVDHVTNGNNYAVFKYSTGKHNYPTSFCSKNQTFPHYHPPIAIVTFVELGTAKPIQCESIIRGYVTEPLDSNGNVINSAVDSEQTSGFTQEVDE